MVKEKSTFPFFKNLLKVVVLAAVAGGAIFGNFMLEQRLGERLVVNSKELTVLDYKNDVILNDYGIIRFSGKEDYVEDPSMKVLKSVEGEYLLEFEKGKFWGNFSASNAKVNILVGQKLIIIPNGAIFSAELSEDELKIMTYGGDLYLGFLDDGMKLEKYEDKYSPLFMNQFVVPRDSQAVIFPSKIDQRLKGLLYSRLFTEFRRSTLPAELKKDKFVVENRQKDEVYMSELSRNFLDDSRFQGRAVAEGGLANAIFWMEENLTFIPDKKDEMVFNHLFSYLDQAVYYANKDDQFRSEEFWEKFNAYRGLLSVDISYSEKYYNKIDSYIDALSVFSPGDRQYDLYKKLLLQKFDENRDVLAVIDKFWLNIYEAMDKSSGMIKGAVTDYYEYLAEVMKSDSRLKIEDDRAYKIFIAYQDQLFENLFLRYQNFYQMIYFDIKNLLEDEILSFYEHGQLKTELAQDFISRKIDFLRRLMNLFFEELVDVQSAKDIADNLIEGIYNLTPPESARTSVTALFQAQLSTITDFWGYLDNVEYNASKAYGNTHKERYETYLKERKKIWTFETMTDVVLGGHGAVTIESLTRVKTEIVGKLTMDKNVTNLQVAEVKDPNARYVEVKYILGGYPVDATFDRDGQTLKDVSVYGESISVEAVKPEDLLKLVDEKLSGKYNLNAVVIDVSFDDSVKTNAKRIAELYLINKIKIDGFEISEGQIKLVDENALIYRIDRIFLGSAKETIVTLDYLSTQEKVTNLYFELNGKPIVLAGEYTFEELRDMISSNQVEEKGEVKKTAR